MTEAHYVIEEPDGRVRWIERNGRRVLQQRWAIKQYDVGHNCIGLTGKWQDVPLERETDED